jgi:predicted metal-binding membrane protein
VNASDITATERLIRRDRAITLAGLVALTLLSWIYVLAGAGTGMSTIAMTTWEFPPPALSAMTADWSPAYWAIMLAMWWVMMVAMMTPSAAPMILLYGRVARHAQKQGRMAAGALPTFIFALGYLAAWLAFSALATVAQWSLEGLSLMHAMLMWSTNTTLTALLLIAAGLFQLTPTKAACLEQCRSPADHLTRYWRDGRAGAFRMGAIHGTWCLGCCWALMALLFAGGIMNLVWIAGLAIVVLIEKVAPWGARFGHALGLAAMAAGGWLLVKDVLV